MNRRHFLGLLGLGVAAAAVDPEFLTWTPGARTHILPPAAGWRPMPPGLAFHPDAFAFVMRDLPLPFGPWTAADRAAVARAAQDIADRIDAQIVEPVYDRETGIAIRFIRAFDPTKYLLPTHLDAFLVRPVMVVDAVVRPELAATIRVRG